ncbi:uncharacterized protein LOC129716896 [Wyeomyia smithii]|uniref:uncharacterized protein LOC129716896 n=1 Tax=Wyeomyia smithii TaxID=174621 RepID=UPI002467F8B3|nr:uncharacterized protein LOC129716896 [Wyeomyia smithii]
MREYLSLGHMRPIEAEYSGNSMAYYLPHHPVIKEASTTTKLRVVFDGSAKTSTGYSRNDALCVGPVVKNDLLKQILRFRTYPIALVSDIAKMYRQVAVQPDDMPMQRIFWRFSQNEPIRIYELATVTYGLAPSSFLAVLQGLDETQIATKSTVHFSPNETIKTLGICWEPEADCLRFESNAASEVGPPTKRLILSSIARLYDPLGIIAPIVIRAKILMQELWQLSCEWDDPVPEPVQRKWKELHAELPEISSYRVKRYAFLPHSAIQLHTFADASEMAYGACSYVRCEDAEGNVQIRLLAPKSRVAPLKSLTVPRLELCAAVLASHLHARVKDAIDACVVKSYFWSDSAVTLHWLRSPPNVWQTYVAHRLAEIQHFTSGCRWSHISGKENPADIVSRGLSVADFLVNDLWKYGPAWLTYSERDWPVSVLPTVPENQLECKVVSAISTTLPVPLVHPWFACDRLLHAVRRKYSC